MGTVHALRLRNFELPEPDLVAAARRGDWWAKQALFKRHVRGVHGLACRLLGGIGDPELAVEQAFADAFAALGGEHPGKGLGHAGKGFETLLEHATIRAVRQQRRRLSWLRWVHRLRRVPALEARFGRPGPVADQLELRRLYDAANRLPESAATALLLRRLERMPRYRIAELMAVSPRRVDRWLERAARQFELED